MRRAGAIALVASFAIVLVGSVSDARVHWYPASAVRVIRTAPALATTPGWQDLGPVPRPADVRGGISVWTGRELIVWGGARTVACARLVVGGSERPAFETPDTCDHDPREWRNDGAALDPAQHQWRPLPDPPLDQPLAYPAAVWTGKLLIVTGQACWAPTAAEACYPGGFPAVAYDPSRNRWATLPRFPYRALPYHSSDDAPAIGWTGRLAVFSASGALVGYDPVEQKWSTLGTADGLPAVCASGHRIVRLESEPISARSQLRRFHFELRSDAKNSPWIKSATFDPTGLLSDNPLHCTTAGASVIRFEEEFDLHADTMKVTSRDPSQIHGAWYGLDDFAPMPQDRGAEIMFPKITTSAFEVGRRVFAVVDKSRVQCQLRPCPLPIPVHIETLLRH